MSKGLSQDIERLKKTTQLHIDLGKSNLIYQIEYEMQEDFSGTIQAFQPPLFLFGVLFQNGVWRELQTIPGGETRSYAKIAKAIENPSLSSRDQ